MGMSIDEAINHLGNYSSTNGSGLTTDKQHNEAKRVAIDTMRKYQKLEQEPRWIPTSERLPKDSGEYLVSVIDEYNENQRYYKAVEVAWFAHKKDYDIKESEWRELGIDETVIAWMPLPKAYREVEE